jgi:UDP-hydrolysing UDP-N-acetyl-D-glucosamine 2-epimerase
LSVNFRRKICVVLVDRANYGRLKPVMYEIKNHPRLELQLVVAGTMVLRRFGEPVRGLKEDGFGVDSELYIELEGSNPISMAKSVGFGIVEFCSEFQKLKPDLILLIGDRYEALSAAIAAAYMNLCIVHVQGGEVSGSIDESARHAISKFAHYHFPSTARSAEYLIRMGERPETILGIGCPSGDIAKKLDRRIPQDMLSGKGSGAEVDFARPFLLAIYHPTTTSYGTEAAQMTEVLGGLERLRMQTVLLWPNIDAGSDDISKTIRLFRDHHHTSDWLRIIINLPPEDYLKVLANAACAIGNSSSFVRDAGFLGTPVVLIGERQRGREHDRNVTPIEIQAEGIADAIRSQLKHGRYPSSTLYGDGDTAPRIAQALVDLRLYVQKRLSFAEEKNNVEAS